MTGGRLTRMGAAAVGLLALAAAERVRGTPKEASRLPRRFRLTLERLGPTFVKIGQALGLRRDLLPEPWLVELRRLQDRVGPFPGTEAQRIVEAAFGRPIEEVFASFEPEPMAAASIAQVHRAQMKDGRAVVVKVRRPGMRAQVAGDMRALRTIGRAVLAIAPPLRRLQLPRLIEEIGTNLRKEIDFRQEARSTRRFADAFRGWPNLYVPEVVDGLYTEDVLVQAMSGGIDISAPSVDGPRLAGVLVDAYLKQFFELGVFHGDPHPGNLFVTLDGRLCFHDFGLVGYLDLRNRRALAVYMQAFLNRDADWLLDAAVDLGLLGGALDRDVFVRGIEEVLEDFASLPMKEWSLAEAALKVARLGSGDNFLVPHNLIVMVRALFLVESALRTLDPDMKIIDVLMSQGREKLERALSPGADAGLARLKTEAGLLGQDLPRLAAVWLHRIGREGGNSRLVLRHEGLESLELHRARTGNRLALALVTLGLYVASSLLMLHGAGPRILGDLPLSAVIGYGFALWLSFRLLRAIARSGRL